MRAYKVVIKMPDDNLFYSVSLAFSFNMYQLKYEFNKITSPIIGKIFVFKDFRCAEIFASQFAHSAILLVEANTLQSIFTVSMTVFDSAIKNFWSNGKGVMAPAPYGSYVCDWVKPIEQIEVKS